MIRTADEVFPEVIFAVHLDHGTEEVCYDCIESGFYSSVMIDASHEEFEKNIEITRRVVDRAHAKGIVVEAELGQLGGVEELLGFSYIFNFSRLYDFTRNFFGKLFLPIHFENFSQLFLGIIFHNVRSGFCLRFRRIAHIRRPFWRKLNPLCAFSIWSELNPRSTKTASTLSIPSFSMTSFMFA